MYKYFRAIRVHARELPLRQTDSYKHFLNMMEIVKKGQLEIDISYLMKKTQLKFFKAKRKI